MSEKYAKAHAEYLAKRRRSRAFTLRICVLWLALAVVTLAAVLTAPRDVLFLDELRAAAVRIFEFAAGCMDAHPLVFMLPVLISMSLIAFIAAVPVWAPIVYAVMVEGYDRRMNVLLMEDVLGAAFGSFTRDEPEMTLLTNRRLRKAKVQRLSWTETEPPFIIFRAKLPSATDPDDGFTFNGVAISTPIADSGLLTDNKRRANVEKTLKKTWKPRLREQDLGRVLFSVDDFEGEAWLTVGFHRMELGARTPEWRDLAAWRSACENTLPTIKRAIAMTLAAAEEVNGMN